MHRHIGVRRIDVQIILDFRGRIAVLAELCHLLGEPVDPRLMFQPGSANFTCQSRKCSKRWHFMRLESQHDWHSSSALSRIPYIQRLIPFGVLEQIREHDCAAMTKTPRCFLRHKGQGIIRSVTSPLPHSPG